jgi:hypothetical protein
MERVWAFVDKRGPDECWPWTGRSRTKHGYGMVHGRNYVGTPYGHRLILQEKLGRVLLPEEQTRHSCDNPSCCNPAHLSVGSEQDNKDDMVRRGRQQRGSGHWNAKLTPAQVLAIRTDSRPSRLVAPEYGITDRSVRRIRQGIRWRDCS